MNKITLSVEEKLFHKNEQNQLISLWSYIHFLKKYEHTKNIPRSLFRDIEKENNYRWEITQQWKENREYKGEKKDTNKQ